MTRDRKIGWFVMGGKLKLNDTQEFDLKQEEDDLHDPGGNVRGVLALQRRTCRAAWLGNNGRRTFGVYDETKLRIESSREW